MTTNQTFKNNISWYPLIWIGFLCVAPFFIHFFEDVRFLNQIVLSFALLPILFQYLEIKLKTVSIEDNTLKIKKIFSKKKIDIANLKYAKLRGDKTFVQLLFGTPKYCVELYGKWGFEILYVDNPQAFLEQLKEKSVYFD